ncbi:MAG TPA: 8-amino-7-oxononanoate synthase [Burkholderiales bacterium]|jgi:8-amino-7-oxononanoate synthase|nr:8-amino-7-oxononanoate synthase [Burkholderiales bacterium]
MRDFAAELEALDKQGLRRTRRVMPPPGEGPLLSFCSNDYLGLASDPRIVEALCEGARRWGAGAGASHLVSGHLGVHEALEQRLAAFVGLPRALLLSSGYLANLAVVPALAGPEAEIFCDRLNHASLNDALLLARSRFRRYAHNDTDALAAALAASRAVQKLVVTDGVFSMDGDLAPLPQLLELCERHDAWLVVDDAHGFGVLGARGAGSLEHFGLCSPRLVYMGTLGKAAGVSGAFVAAAAHVIELLVQRARTYVYTTASPPALAAALLRSLDLIAAESWRRERLSALVDRLRTRLPTGGWRLLPSRTPIQPLIVGDNGAAVALSARLESEGILVPAIRPPTVPEGSARLRISLSAAHSEADVDRLARAINDARDGGSA